MARNESDREDLMREATALVRRAELSYPGVSELVVGFFRDGRLAVYFGSEPVYQFDDQHRLRRAFADGFLFRSQGETLARLTRKRTPSQTQLIRHDLNLEELENFRQSVSVLLSGLHEAILAGEARVHAQIPADGNFLEELNRALMEILDRNLPLAPPIPGKR